MNRLVLMLSLLLFSMMCSAQINIALLHQLVENSKSEHSRQRTISEKQAWVSAMESANAAQSSTLKSTYLSLRKKFSAVGMVIDLMQLSAEAPEILKQISSDQMQIFSICQKNPALGFLAAQTQVDLVDRSQLLLRYLYGLALSTSELGAMSRSDRSMLISFAISELRQISLILSGLKKTLLAYHSLASARVSAFLDMSSTDKQITWQILSKLKQRKNN